jgi:hypothetical protein
MVNFMIFDKNSIGMDVVLVPTGNNVRRGKGLNDFEQAVHATVISMARTKGVLLTKHTQRNIAFTVNPNHKNEIKTAMNSGYDVYRTIEMVNLRHNAYKVRRHLIINIHELSDDELIKIGKSLSILSLD